jgi:GntR family transcriptional regulator, transcriptional repressor for pyruvate dehydrogenase complex
VWDVTVQQVLRPPAYQILADDLRAQITSGLLRPGERLPTEPQLCLRSGVSRSTVREALRLLASQHLIVTTRGVTGGSFVAHPSPEQLSDTLTTGMSLLLTSSAASLAEMLEVRAMLEVPAAALAAVRRTEWHLEQLGAALDDPAGDAPETRLDRERAFHAVLSAAAANPLFELLTRALYQLPADPEEDAAAVSAGRFWSRVDAEHREILRCVTVGDSAGAARAAGVHLTSIGEKFAAR